MRQKEREKDEEGKSKEIPMGQKVPASSEQLSRFPEREGLREKEKKSGRTRQ